MAEELMLAFENASRRQATQGLVRLIDRGQQLDVSPRKALRETPPPVNGGPDLPAACSERSGV
jgi:hypothetical protein